MAPLNTNKLSKLLSLAASDNDAEAVGAVRKAQALLSSAGMSFNDVAQRLKDSPAPPPQAAAGTVRTSSSFADIFANFDDHMEVQQPGWKAKQAEQRAERIRKESDERAAAIAKYGSVRAGKLPDRRERLLNKAVKHLRRTIRKDYANGAFNADSLDGWTSIYDADLPASVRTAIEGAYPMPSSLREAREEYRCWQARDRELERLYCEPGECGGDYFLGLPSAARMRIVQEAYWHGPINTVDDLLVRIEHMAENDGSADQETAASVLEAFRRLVVSCTDTAAGDKPFLDTGIVRAVSEAVKGLDLASDSLGIAEARLRDGRHQMVEAALSSARHEIERARSELLLEGAQ